MRKYIAIVLLVTFCLSFIGCLSHNIFEDEHVIASVNKQLIYDFEVDMYKFIVTNYIDNNSFEDYKNNYFDKDIYDRNKNDLDNFYVNYYIKSERLFFNQFDGYTEDDWHEHYIKVILKANEMKTDLVSLPVDTHLLSIYLEFDGFDVVNQEIKGYCEEKDINYTDHINYYLTKLSYLFEIDVVYSRTCYDDNTLINNLFNEIRDDDFEPEHWEELERLYNNLEDDFKKANKEIDKIYEKSDIIIKP